MDYKKKILEILEQFDPDYAEPAKKLVNSGGEKTPFQWFLMYQTLVEELVDATGKGSKEIEVEFEGKQYKFKDLNEMLGHMQKEGSSGLRKESPKSKMKTPKKSGGAKCKKRS